jgi:hyperosmotically inducible periplasmic protein
MPRALRLIALLLVVVATTTACQSISGKSAGQNLDDASITARVKSKLVAEKAGNLTRVNVDTNGGTVYLSGVVDTKEQKTRIQQIARDVLGVKSVVNNLQIQKR